MSYPLMNLYYVILEWKKAKLTNIIELTNKLCFIEANKTSLNIKISDKYLVPSQEKVQLGNITAYYAKCTDTQDNIDTGKPLSK